MIWSAGRGLQRMIVVPEALVDLSRLQYALVAAAIPLLYHFVCIVLHKEHGEVARHTVNPDMLNAGEAA